MEFIVKRSSSVCTGRIKPCDEAMSTDKKGSWIIEIESIDELCRYIKKYNCIVLYEHKGQYTLRICDTF